MKYFAVLMLFLAAPALAQQVADNPEMARMFEADQSVRANLPKNVTPDIIKQMIADDEARRTRTSAMLNAGALHTGHDYERAAFIFQHGDTPADYLLAHSLAMIAMAKGNSDAKWIAAATLDRYLQAIGQQQIYGTQYRFPKPGEVGQDPYDRTLISDALRAELGVPAQAEQEKRRASMQVKK